MEENNLVISILNENGDIVETKILTWKDFEIEQVGGSERQMGPENEHVLTCTTDEFEITCEVYEYPIGVFNYKSDWRIESGNVRIESDDLNYFGLFTEQE
ncbi:MULTISPECIES: hypothetical protein [Neisseria]|uniref:Uncharacterized protein n=2 Tax=Neisseria TaxID=482 RepID=A0A448VQ40_9NEIS|nr:MULTISPECIES: hypothetical protein [Neisseria]EGV37735.1 hypothetical protein l11_09760 [Neisseria weaveri LMG 5135]OSI11417.1 hypothetical protein BWD10_00100 [Neisseria zoodegmatis]SNU80039.1 Uncharacterised protein [Neisseria zoodegmatis]VEJ51887.1 Uncharacterised protein [Neisseria weaveri]